MNWEAFGAIAEMIGSLAVLVTLIYLAFQVRQASKIAMSSSTNHARAGVSDTLSAISGDTETAKTYTTGMVDPESLELYQRVRFDLIIFQTLRVTETAFFEGQDGLIRAELWESQWRGERKILRTKGGRESWARQRDLMSETFMRWVDENLDEA